MPRQHSGDAALNSIVREFDSEAEIGYTLYSLWRNDCMVTKIQKWGNSQGLRVSKEVLEQVHAAVGDAVEVSVQKGTILIQPIKRLRGKYSLRHLVAQMPKNYKPIEEDWGKPVGKEVW